MIKVKVNTQFVFSGEFIVIAEDMENAKKIVEQSCSLVMGKDIHIDSDSKVVDCHFNTHPNTVITKITRISSVEP